ARCSLAGSPPADGSRHAVRSGARHHGRARHDAAGRHVCADGADNGSVPVSASAPPPVSPAAARRAVDRDILSLAVPSLGALIAEPLFLMADSAFIARVSTVS